MIALSAVRDSSIFNVTIVDAPQDAIFIRNGGVNCTVENNTIRHHNRLWGNGEGINVEMHVDGAERGSIIISHNVIVTDAPNFCSANLSKVCKADIECGSDGKSRCGGGASTSAGIGLTWVNGDTPVRALISDNEVTVGNNHYGILCNGCADTRIEHNKIHTVGGSDPRQAAFVAINVVSPPTRPANHVVIEGNQILGGNVPTDGRAILASGGPLGDSVDLVIRGNQIQNKIVDAGASLIEVRGWRRIQVGNNSFTNVNGRPIQFGFPGWKTADIQVKGNTFFGVKMPQGVKTIETRGETNFVSH
jgi:hypothetical protein